MWVFNHSIYILIILPLPYMFMTDFIKLQYPLCITSYLSHKSPTTMSQRWEEFLDWYITSLTYIIHIHQGYADAIMTCKQEIWLQIPLIVENVQISSVTWNNLMKFHYWPFYGVIHFKTMSPYWMTSPYKTPLPDI